MSEHYDRQGNPLTLMEWARRLEASPDQRHVAETTLPNGRWVSTVWLGLDHSFGSGPPLIFETMVFPSKDEMGDLDCERYSTEAEALAGHQRLCEKWAVEQPESEDAATGAEPR
jgi:hypothetical protein